jgi:hypothetical protein
MVSLSSNINFAEDEGEPQALNYVLKTISILTIFGITIAFGFFPFFW